MMRVQRRLLLTLVGLSLLLSACRPTPTPFVCTDAIGCVTIAPGEAVKFGALYTLSGSSADTGIDQARTIELVSAKRGDRFLGHPLEMQILDEFCSPEGGATGALRLVADPQLVGILGTDCSGAAVTAGEIMSKAGLVMISGANSAPSLTSVAGERGTHWQAGYFRTAWVDTVIGEGAATFAYQELGVTKVAIVHGGDTYTQGLAEIFHQAFTALGGDVVLEVAIDEADTEHYPLLHAVALSGAELMYFPLNYADPCAAIVRMARETPELASLNFIGSEVMISEVFMDAIGEDGVGVYLAGPAAIQGAEEEALRAAYYARFGEYPLSLYYSFTYDAANLLLDTVATVAVQDPDGTLHIGRQALRDALYATRDYPGLTGRLTCDEFGDCGAAKLNILRLDDPTAGVAGLRANVVYVYPSAEGE